MKYNVQKNGIINAINYEQINKATTIILMKHIYILEQTYKQQYKFFVPIN